MCFCEYQNNNDIGFVDKREANQADIIPFSETADKIAFITRSFGKCERGSSCERGDMLLNVLEIDNFCSPMKFELHTTHYEACMDEGMQDDNIQKCIVTQVTSVRGLDVAFIAQYNERIIMDCITSTKQLPVRFPLPANKKEEADLKEKDTDYQLREGGFE